MKKARFLEPKLKPFQSERNLAHVCTEAAEWQAIAKESEKARRDDPESPSGRGTSRSSQRTSTDEAVEVVAAE
jgi:hypothetical protein